MNVTLGMFQTESSVVENEVSTTDWQILHTCCFYSLLPDQSPNICFIAKATHG